MNHYYHKHALKLSLPLFILLAGCSFPIESKRQITVTTEVLAVSLSATPISLASPSELPSATILPSFTVTSMPAITPTSTPTIPPTSTAISAETIVLIPTQPTPILQPSGNQDSLSPSVENQNSPSSPDLPGTANDRPNDGSVPSGDQNNQQPALIVVVIIPPAGVPLEKPTPLPICLACTGN
jgi:hypothetical protein